MSRPARDGDAAEMRRAALTVARRVTLASLVLVVVILTSAVVFILNQSRPRELLELPKPGQSKIYVDSIELLTAVGFLGLLAVFLVGAASWAIARGAVRPLGAALRVQRAFVADASHELRTPLAVLDARVQMLQRRLPSEGEVADEIAAIRADTKALGALVTDLLEIADADGRAGVSATGAADVNAAAVAADVGAAMQAVAADRGISLVVEAPSACPVRVPPASLRRCIVALVDNALTHSPAGSSVTIGVAAAGRSAVVTVTDQGTGVAGVDQSRIFDRFARADPPATESSASGAGAVPPRRGFGIGLALVRDVVTRHGGSVEVADTSSDGTVMRIELPLA